MYSVITVIQKEEMKVTNETKKILHLDADTPISCTAVRVPFSMDTLKP